jgi:hypothetical protein
VWWGAEGKGEAARGGACVCAGDWVGEDCDVNMMLNASYLPLREVVEALVGGSWVRGESGGVRDGREEGARDGGRGDAASMVGLCLATHRWRRQTLALSAEVSLVCIVRRIVLVVVIVIVIEVAVVRAFVIVRGPPLSV